MVEMIAVRIDDMNVIVDGDPTLSQGGKVEVGVGVGWFLTFESED